MGQLAVAVTRSQGRLRYCPWKSSENRYVVETYWMNDLPVGVSMKYARDTEYRHYGSVQICLDELQNELTD